MKTIWKFETPFEEKFSLQMPKGAEIIAVQRHDKTNIPCIWAIVTVQDFGTPMEERFFELFGPGHNIPEDMGVARKYLGTYQYQRGEFVGHLFERTN